MFKNSEGQYVLYECGICGGLHTWEFDGDCRKDSERFNDVAEFCSTVKCEEPNVEIRSMQDRVDADFGNYFERK